MAEQAFKRANATPPLHVNEPIAIRRFELPDLSQHGGWVTERLAKLYPHLAQGQLYGWLNSILYSRDVLFLFQDHAVAMARLVTGYTLAPQPMVQEEFVFIEDKNNAEHVELAAAFYLDFARWAKALGAEVIVLAPERSDVPVEKIKGAGRVFQRQQTFVNLKG